MVRMLWSRSAILMRMTRMSRLMAKSILYEYAREHHGAQMRRDGTPYITHPLQVAQIVAEMRLLPSLLQKRGGASLFEGLRAALPGGLTSQCVPASGAGRASPRLH